MAGPRRSSADATPPPFIEAGRMWYIGALRWGAARRARIVGVLAMLHLNVLLTVKDPANVDTVRNLLVEAAKHSRAEPGCARFEVYHSTADNTKFLLNEHWESQAAIDGHRKGHAYTQIYQPKVLPLVTREGHPSTLL
jgi:quinol monooxygenase YgiN